MAKPSKMDRYFDAEGRQVKALPGRWTTPSKHYKPGDKVEWIGPGRVPVGDEWVELAGDVGEVLEVHDTTPMYPWQFYSAQYECWVTESPGWLVVRFRGDVYGTDEAGNVSPRACRMEDEGVSWRKAKRIKQAVR